MTIAEFKALVKTSVTLKTAPNSVPPKTLGARFNNLADMVAAIPSGGGAAPSIQDVMAVDNVTDIPLVIQGPLGYSEGSDGSVTIDQNGITRNENTGASYTYTWPSPAEEPSGTLITRLGVQQLGFVASQSKNGVVITTTGEEGAFSSSMSLQNEELDITHKRGDMINSLYIATGYQSIGWEDLNTGDYGRIYVQQNNGSAGMIATNQITLNAPKTVFASITHGMILPRLTTMQRNAVVSPEEGEQIYNTTTHSINYFNGTVWKEVATTP
jgi:hypothetical protein